MIDDDRFRALGNATRRRLLVLVRDDECDVGQLSAAVGVSQPATSQHLAVLRAAGLVTVRPEGRRRLYRADHGAIGDLAAFFTRYWTTAVDRLADVAERRARDRASAA